MAFVKNLHVLVVEPIPSCVAYICEAMKTITIRNLDLVCVIGCPGWERFSEQRLIVDLELTLDEQADWLSQDLAKTHCYAQTQRLVRFILGQGRFYLLENAAQFLINYFLLPSPSGSQKPRVTRVAVQLVKPDILPGATEVVVSMVQDFSSHIPCIQEQHDWGIWESVAQNQQTQLARLTVKQGCPVPSMEQKQGYTGLDHVFDESAPSGSMIITRLWVANT